jgi:hypothetical protein
MFENSNHVNKKNAGGTSVYCGKLKIFILKNVFMNNLLLALKKKSYYYFKYKLLFTNFFSRKCGRRDYSSSSKKRGFAEGQGKEYVQYYMYTVSIRVKKMQVQ